MGRPSVTTAQKRQLANTLRVELQLQIERGRCAYCRAPARPDEPLTREHVIPRARGGRRKDVRIIVPACARCNHHRGCKDLIPFLLGRPERISSFLDYLGTLSPESIREIDVRIFAELYAAIAILVECTAHGVHWQAHLDRLCTGRSLHRRRYAARRAVGAVSRRLASSSRGEEAADYGVPSCRLPSAKPAGIPVHLAEPIERIASRVTSVLALLWHVSAETVERELTRELGGAPICVDSRGIEEGEPWGEADDGIVELDGWRARPKRKRGRIDRRRGRTNRQQRIVTSQRGRAA